MPSAHRYTWQRSDGSTGKAWRAKYVGPDGKTRYRRGFAKKGEALEYATDREAEARHGVALPDLSGGTTVAAWALAWQAGLNVRPETSVSYGFALSRILPTFGPRPLTSIRPSEVKAWRRGLRKQDGTALADSTADKVQGVFATMLRAAVDDGLLEKSPMPRGGARTVRVVDPAELLTTEQVRAWSAALPVWLQAAPVVAATTGLRQGELLGLRLPNVDFMRRQVHVVEQLRTPTGAGEPSWQPTKTASGVRTVPLPLPAAEALARHVEVQPAVAGEPIFRTQRGRRWRAGGFQQAVLAGRKSAGLPEWATWHSLRDCYPSGLIRMGADVRTVATYMGHSNPSMTLAVYSRLWRDSSDNARAMLDALWRDDEGEAGAK